MMTEADQTLKLFAALILFAVLRSIKLIPLTKFWIAMVTYDHDVPERLLQWEPNKYEEYVATVIEWMIIGLVGALLIWVAVSTVYLYVNGGTWTEVFHRPKDAPVPDWLEPPRAVPRMYAVRQVEPPRAAISLATPARRLNNENKCVHCGPVHGKCCCEPRCRSGVSFSYPYPDAKEANEKVKFSLETWGTGMVLGSTVGPMAGAAYASFLGENVAVGSTIGGPAGAIGGFIVGVTGGLLVAFNTAEAPKCIAKCAQMFLNPPGCTCDDR